MYSEELLDHFQHPRNAGELSDSDAAAEIENPVCGDVIRFTVRMHGNRIAAIRFKAKGCAASMACASAVTVLATGKSPVEARSLQRDSLITEVGGLPPASTHAAQLALDTLVAALDQIASEHTPDQSKR